MTFKYNPLTGELNIFGVKESNTTPNQPQEHTGNGFWYYLENDTTLNFSTSNVFAALPQLKESWNTTGVEISATNEYVVPTSGIWFCRITPTIVNAANSIVQVTAAVNNNGNIIGSGGASFDFVTLNKGDKITLGVWASYSTNNAQSVTLQSGILSTFVCMILMAPTIQASTTPSNKDSNSNSGNSSNNSNTSGNTNSGSNTNKPNSNTSGNTNSSDNTNNSNSNQNNNSNISKYLLTDFTVSPATILQYTFDATNAGNPVNEPIINWVTSKGDHPLGTGTVTVSEDANWSFSWTLPTADPANGFSLSLEVNINGRTLAKTSQYSVSAPLKKGDQVNFTISGYFPSSAPSNAQVTVTIDPNNSSLTAKKQG